jgi:hypothetical protein
VQPLPLARFHKLTRDFTLLQDWESAVCVISPGSPIWVFYVDPAIAEKSQAVPYCQLDEGTGTLPDLCAKVSNRRPQGLFNAILIRSPAFHSSAASDTVSRLQSATSKTIRRLKYRLRDDAPGGDLSATSGQEQFLTFDLELTKQTAIAGQASSTGTASHETESGSLDHVEGMPAATTEDQSLPDITAAGAALPLETYIAARSRFVLQLPDRCVTSGSRYTASTFVLNIRYIQRERHLHSGHGAGPPALQ